MQYLTPFPGYRKTLILQRRKEELRHALQHNFPPNKLAEAAERVRTAKLHLIKALRAALTDRPPVDPLPDDQLANLESESDFWEGCSANKIIEEYKSQKA